jgi:hypothetical protein
MVATDIFGRGIDMEKINVVFNFDMPTDSDSYLHRVYITNNIKLNRLAELVDLEQRDWQ